MKTVSGSAIAGAVLVSFLFGNVVGAAAEERASPPRAVGKRQVSLGNPLFDWYAPRGEITRQTISSSCWRHSNGLETLLNLRLPRDISIRWTNVAGERVQVELIVEAESSVWHRTATASAADGGLTFTDVPRGNCEVILRSLDHRHPLFVTAKLEDTYKLEDFRNEVVFDGRATGCVALRMLDESGRPVAAGVVRLQCRDSRYSDRRLNVLRWTIEDDEAWAERTQQEDRRVQRLADGTFIVIGLGPGTYSIPLTTANRHERSGGGLKADGGLYMELHHRTRSTPEDAVERAEALRLQTARLKSEHVPVKAWGIIRLGYHGADAAAVAGELVEALSDQRSITTSVVREHGLGSTIAGFAATSLGQIGPGATPALIEGLKHPLAIVRKSAAQLLGDQNRHDPAVVEPLIAGLSDADNEVAGRMALSLGFVGAPAVDRLIGLVKTGTLRQRRGAVYALGVHRAPRGDSILLAALNDPAAEVRQTAAEAISNLFDPRLVRSVVERLDTDDPVVRPLLIRYLEHIDDETRHQLMELCDHPNVRIRRGVAQALCQQHWWHANSQSLPLLLKTQDDDAEVRRWAVASLKHSMPLVGPRVAWEVLSTGLRDPDAQVRAEATGVSVEFASQWRDDTRPVMPLVALLSEADDQTKLSAVKALGAFRDRRATEALVLLATDNPAPALWKAIVAALCQIGDPRGAAVLRAAFNSTDPISSREDVIAKAEVIRALGELRDRESLDTLVDQLDGFREEWGAAAATALAQLEDVRAAEPLMDAVRNNLRWHRFGRQGRVDQFSHIAGALGCVGDRRAARFLVSTAHQAGPFQNILEMELVNTFGPPNPSRIPLETAMSWHPYPAALVMLGPEAVPSLLEGLKSEHAVTRIVCAQALGSPLSSTSTDFSALMRTAFRTLPGEALEFRDRIEGQETGVARALLAALRDDELLVRLAAVDGLGNLELRSAVPPLIAALDAPFAVTKIIPFGNSVLPDYDGQRERFRASIARALGMIGGDEAEAALRGLMRDADGLVKLFAIEGLGRAKAGESVTHLIELLSGRDIDLSVTAANALAGVGDRNAIQPLIACLHPDIPDTVCSAAVQALGQLNAREAGPELTRLLTRFDPAQKEPEAQEFLVTNVAVLLLRWQDQAGIEWFRRRLVSNDEEIRTKALDHFAWYAEVDVDLAPLFAATPLMEQMRRQALDGSDEQTRTRALGVLRFTTDEASQAVLVRCLDDPLPRCRSRALQSLAKRDLGTLPPLVTRLKNDPDTYVRCEVVELLSGIRSDAATDALIEMLDDSRREVSGAALQALADRRSARVHAAVSRLKCEYLPPRRLAEINRVLHTVTP